jgi:hypothetical protein
MRFKLDAGGYNKNGDSRHLCINEGEIGVHSELFLSA